MLDFGLPTMFALEACFLAALILSFLATTPSTYADVLLSVEKGFQISPSQISLHWGTFKPFLASPNGNFALGFDTADSNSYILALMYIIRSSNGPLSNDTDAPLSMEMIWSANHLSPNRSEDVILSINEQGNLLLSDASMGITIWSTGTATSGPTTLFLENSGNLVLSSTNNVSSVNVPIMWQSFEHPTDTLLQGQNFTASMRLTSLLHTASTVQVLVFLQMEEDGIALYADLGRSSSQHMYWKLEADQETAIIDSENSTIYARMSSMGYLGMYESEEERVSYEVFDTYNSSEVVHRQLKLDADGNLRVYYWANTSWQIDLQAVEELCSLPYACGPYSICSLGAECMCVASGNVSSGRNEKSVSFVRANESDVKQGCVLRNAESFLDDGCASGQPDKGLFVQSVGMDSLFHENEKESPGASSNASSVEECEALCHADCACTAFFYNKGPVANKCFLAYDLAEQSMVQTGNIDDLAFIKLSSAAAAATASYKALSSSEQTEPSRGGRQRSLTGQIIAAIVGTLVMVLLGVFAVYRYTKGIKGVIGGSADLETKPFLSEVPGLPPFVRYKELELGTANFSIHRRAGLLGSLYEGTLAGGAHVAIARLTLVNQVDLHEVKLTLAAVGRITHPNLARLCCYSIDGANLALGYELPPNGWLDLAALSWRHRVRVGMGVANALAALHEGGKMVHGLLNLEAVFVTGGGEAKVGGVGVAELVASGLAVPPLNLAESPDLADARDVLHFGMVLTELLTGQQVKGDYATWRLRWRDAIGKGRPGQLLDRAIVADAMRESDDQLLRLATSAGLCLHPSPLQRPSISTAIRILDRSLSALPLV
ncbi:hypothetical protein GOP47_0028699 [Adiantum capillus-veneris]|nr:hypothetical protein GOP47_0028699 [Adiantum capillus-veneris]